MCTYGGPIPLVRHRSIVRILISLRFIVMLIVV